MAEPTELERVLAWTKDYEDYRRPVEVPALVLAEAHRLLREMARDFEAMTAIAEPRNGQWEWFDAACERWRLSE